METVWRAVRNTETDGSKTLLFEECEVVCRNNDRSFAFIKSPSLGEITLRRRRNNPAMYESDLLHGQLMVTAYDSFEEGVGDQINIRRTMIQTYEAYLKDERSMLASLEALL